MSCTPRIGRGSRGVTLLELLVVLAVLVLLMGVGLSGLDQVTGAALRTQTNRLSATIRHAYNRSVAEGLYVRLVLSPETDQYRVEASSERVFIDVEQDALEAAEAAERQQRSERDEEQPQVKPARFEVITERTGMTRGIGIDGVITAGREDVVTTGDVAIHFFPSGFVEPAMIYTTDGAGNFFTLRVNPMTGHVKREAGRIDPDREFGQPDRVEEESR